MLNTLLSDWPNQPPADVSDMPRQKLNLLLGVALLGTLLITIQSFGLTEAQLHQLVRGPHGGNYWLLTSIDALAGNSMSALLALVFGASMLLFLNGSGIVSRLASPELLIRALMWLILLGLVNALGLLAVSDVLFSFAIVGILLFPLRRLSEKGLLVASISMGLIFAGKSYWDFTDQTGKYTKYQTVVALEKKYKALEKKAKVDPKTKKKAKTPALTEEQKEDKSTWEGMVKGQKFDKEQNESTIRTMRSDYAVTWASVLPKVQEREASYLYRLGIWDLAALMLLGMALFKLGFFENRFTTNQYLGLAVAGIAIGQGVAWLTLPATELRITDYTKYISTSLVPLDRILLPIERMASAVGWASFVLVMVRAGLLAWFWRAVEAVGKMGFSNYLFQMALCSWFFYGYGLGYFGQFRLFQLYFVVAEIWMLQLVISVLWLRYFRTGPMEWLWETLTYGQRQPFRLATPVEPVSTSTPILS